MALLAGAMQPARAQTLHLLTNNNPPFSIVDPQQRITGISADIVVEMARRAKVPVTLEQYPWARAFDAALHEEDACIFSASRLPERQAHFQWIGPIATNSWALFARGDFTGTLPNLEAAQGMVIGGQVQEAKSAYLEQHGLPVDVLPDDDLNPRRLKEGRIDLWVTGLYTGQMKAAERGMTGLKPVLVFRRVENYLACNLSVAAPVIDGLRKAFDGMRADGKLHGITQKYIEMLGRIPTE